MKGAVEHEEIVSLLEEEIVLGLLHPRERLIEDNLIARFGTKRHIVRQCFVDLERMGLVERKRHFGAIVRAYSAEEVANLFEVRELLETFCAGTLVLPVAEEQIVELERIEVLHDEAVRAGDLRKIFRSNMAFHKALFGLSGNPVLIAAIQDHAQRAHAIRSSTLGSKEFTEKARREHWEMIGAIRSQNQARLVDLCRIHLAPSRDEYIQQTADHRGDGRVSTKAFAR